MLSRDNELADYMCTQRGGLCIASEWLMPSLSDRQAETKGRQAAGNGQWAGGRQQRGSRMLQALRHSVLSMWPSLIG